MNVDQGGANVVSFTENNGGSNNDPIGWVTLPVTTPFTLTSVGRNSGFGSWMYLGAIEVDGVVIAEGATVGGSGGGAASVIGVDGSASFGGNVTASAVPTADDHLVNKLYADNLVAGVDLSGIATNAAAIEALTNGAPELLNTLAELGDALGDDENFATTVTNQISAETTARTNADTALSNRLDTLEADPTTQTLLDAETAARQAADTAEAAARQAADDLLLPLAGGTLTGDLGLGSGGASEPVGQSVFTPSFTSTDQYTIFSGSGQMTSLVIGVKPGQSSGRIYSLFVDGVQVIDPAGSWDLQPSNHAAFFQSSSYAINTCLLYTSPSPRD